jgi:P-type Ca2+ transporter type 2C
MDRAFRELGEEYLAGTEHLHRSWELVREYPLSEKLLALSQVWRSPDSSRYLIAAKGAPEAIADLCHLVPAERAALDRQVEAATAGGERVLAVARAEVSQREGLPTGQHDFPSSSSGWRACGTRCTPASPRRWPSAGARAFGSS